MWIEIHDGWKIRLDMIKDLCDDVDSTMVSTVDKLGITSIYNVCDAHTTLDNLTNMVYNVCTYDALTVLLDRNGLSMDDMVYYRSGSEAITFILGDLLVKITTNPRQSVEAIKVMDSDDVNIVKIYDVCENVMLCELLDDVCDDLYKYIGIINQIRVSDIHFKLSDSLMGDVVRDVQASKMAYRKILEINDVDVTLVNIGRNRDGKYLIFDW